MCTLGSVSVLEDLQMLNMFFSQPAVKYISPLDLQISLLEAIQRHDLNNHSFNHIIWLLLKNICPAREVGIFSFPLGLVALHLTLERTQDTNFCVLTLLAKKSVLYIMWEASAFSKPCIHHTERTQKVVVVGFEKLSDVFEKDDMWRMQRSGV